MKKYNDYNIEFSIIIKGLKEDYEAFDRKEEFYSHLWEKCQMIENTLTADDPEWVFNKLYKVWEKAAKLSSFYGQTALLTQKEMEIKNYFIPKGKTKVALTKLFKKKFGL